MSSMPDAVSDRSTSRLRYSITGTYVGDIIKALVGGITPDQLSGLVRNNISFWQECIPKQTREMIREEAANFRDAIADVPPEIVRDWVLDARPDFIGVLSDEVGRSWLDSTVLEIRNSLVS